MSKIIVDKIFIEDFKRIKSQTIEVFPITAIVGGNASGKVVFYKQLNSAHLLYKPASNTRRKAVA